MLETFKLYFPSQPTAIHRSWPQSIYTSTVPHRDLMLSIESFRKKLRKECYLICRGERGRRFLCHSLVYGQRPQWGPVPHDFGNGLYFSPDLDYVKSYTGAGGSVQAVNWSRRRDNLKSKYFRRSDKNDDRGAREWERLVKSSICFDTSISWEAPAIFDEDILVGPVSSNYRRILQCNRPEKCPETQIVARTDSACNWMRRTLSVFSLSAEWVRGWRVEMEVRAGRGSCNWSCWGFDSFVRGLIIGSLRLERTLEGEVGVSL